MSNKTSQPIQALDTPIMLFHGRSRSNSGDAAAAAVLLMPQGRRYTVSQFLCAATNSEAEYTGLLIGLKKAQQLGIRQLEIKGDSELVFNQVNGLSKVNLENLRLLYREARKLIDSFDKVNLEWIPREQNRSAAAAVNRCIEEALGVESQPVISTAKKVTASVERILKLGAKATSEHYKHLAVQNDDLSAKTLSELRTMIPSSIQDAIALGWDGDEQAFAEIYRWYLRGLPPEMAMRKVQSDTAVKENNVDKLPWEGQLIASVETESVAEKIQETFLPPPSQESLIVDDWDTLLAPPHEPSEEAEQSDTSVSSANVNLEEVWSQDIASNLVTDNSREAIPFQTPVISIVEMIKNLSQAEKITLVRELVKSPELVNLMLKALADNMSS